MNRFVKNMITSGMAACAVAATAGAMPALASSHSADGHIGTRSEIQQMHNSDPGPSGGSDPLVATGAPVAGSATGSIWPMTAVASDATAIDRQIRHLPAGHFNVVGLDAAERDSQSSSFKLRANEPGYLANLHRSIEANRPLLARLEARDVEIRNVIGAEPGGNGSMTFYVE